MKAVVIMTNHSGRFGNKLLHYNNACLLSKYYDCEVYTSYHDDYKYFNINLLNDDIIDDINKSSSINLNAKKLMIRGYDSILDYDYLILNPCLGEMFFEFNFDIKDHFIFKNIDVNLPKLYIGIHFRGTDFHQWNEKSILSSDYYKDSIDYCNDNYDNPKYLLLTDDKNLKSYNDTIQYLKDSTKDFSLGPNTNKSGFIDDFTHLCMTDVIISSPSTFAICAGFIYKSKDIIHSKNWVESRVAENDEFWVKLYKGGNDNYKIKKVI